MLLPSFQVGYLVNPATPIKGLTDFCQRIKDKVMNKVSEKWQQRFMEMSFMVAKWSKDPSTQVGAVIADGNRIVSQGFNGYPHGVADQQDPRELKYQKTLHGELNAILHAGRSLHGCTLFSTHMPCTSCCATIIQVGISVVVVPEQTEDYLSRWGDSVKVSQSMFDEAGVEVVQLKSN